MKAILVIDMPKGCLYCPLRDWEQDYCVLLHDFIPNLDPNMKLDKCPLRPLPNKQETARDEAYSIEDYRIGWNDCLKEIGK